MNINVTKLRVKFEMLDDWETFVLGSTAYLKIPAIGHNGSQFNVINLSSNQFSYFQEFMEVDPRSHEIVIK